MSAKSDYRERSCTTKVRYASVGAAELEARYLRRASGDARFQAYRCRFCRAYHVGKSSMLGGDELRDDDQVDQQDAGGGEQLRGDP